MWKNLGKLFDGCIISPHILFDQKRPRNAITPPNCRPQRPPMRLCRLNAVCVMQRCCPPGMFGIAFVLRRLPGIICALRRLGNRILASGCPPPPSPSPSKPSPSPQRPSRRTLAQTRDIPQIRQETMSDALSPPGMSAAAPTITLACWAPVVHPGRSYASTPLAPTPISRKNRPRGALQDMSITAAAA